MSTPYLDPTAPIAQTRRNLPHWHQERTMQFVTFRQADSLPQQTLVEMLHGKDRWLAAHPAPWSTEVELEYHRRFSRFVDDWLDKGYGCCLLRNPANARIVEEALFHFDTQRYILHDYVIMPNHLHLLIEPLDGWPLSKILQTIKRHSSRTINLRTGQQGQLWSHESFDRLIRDEEHYNNVKGYIIKNIKQGGILWASKH